MQDKKQRRIWTPVVKDWAVFEKYGRETNCEYTQLKISLAPGCQNAAHYHGSYSETSTAWKGNVGIYSKAKGERMLTPGESATVTPGEVHYFFNPEEEDAEMNIRLELARKGFEKGLYLLYGLARDGKSAHGGLPHSIMHSAIIFVISDLWIAGFGGMLMTPVMKILAFFGRVSGTEEELISRYWTPLQETNITRI